MILVNVRWLDGYLETFECSKVRQGGYILWMRLTNGQNRTIPLSGNVRWFSTDPESHACKKDRSKDLQRLKDLQRFAADPEPKHRPDVPFPLGPSVADPCSDAKIEVSRRSAESVRLYRRPEVNG